MTMKRCKSCDSEVVLTSKFCHFCGNPIGQILSESLEPASAKFAKNVTSKTTTDIRDKLQSTLFVVSSSFEETLQSLLANAQCKAHGIVSCSDKTQMISAARIVLRDSIKQVKYVVIIGDWDQVPPIVAPNPLTMDGDAHCLTDAPYACLADYSAEDALTAVPVVPIGRIPTHDAEVVRRVLFETPKFRSVAESMLFAVSASCWREATQEIVNQTLSRKQRTDFCRSPDVLSRLPRGAVITSPDWSHEDLEEKSNGKIATPNGIMLFNVHGGADTTHWVGESEEGEYPTIFTPTTVSDFNSSLIVCEACYGGALGYDEPSVVERFFSAGGVGFVGSSTIAYGSPTSQLCAADVIANQFLLAFERGASIGESLNTAKMELLILDPLNDDIAKKTVLSFNLFGVPWHTMASAVANRAPLPPATTRPVSLTAGSVLDRIRSRKNTNFSIEKPTLDEVRLSYQARLPLQNQKFMLDAIEARRLIRGFSDYSHINDLVTRWGGSVDDALLDFVSFDNTSGYRIFSKSKRTGREKGLLIVTLDPQGNIQQTLMSKENI